MNKRQSALQCLKKAIYIPGATTEDADYACELPPESQRDPYKNYALQSYSYCSAPIDLQLLQDVLPKSVLIEKLNCGESLDEEDSCGGFSCSWWEPKMKGVKTRCRKNCKWLRTGKQVVCWDHSI